MIRTCKVSRFTRHPNKYAMSLIEVLVVCGILGLFLGMVGDAVVSAYRAHVSTVDKSTNYRMAAIALARMSRELATCNTWKNPLPLGGPTFTPSVTNKMYFIRNDATTGANPYPFTRIGTDVQYWLDVPTQEIRRLDPSTGGVRVAARGVRAFNVTVAPGTVNTGNVSVAILVNDINTPLNITVQPPSF